MKNSTIPNKIISAKQILFATLSLFSLSIFAQPEITFDEPLLAQNEMKVVNESTNEKLIVKPTVAAPDFLIEVMSKLKKSIADSMLSFIDDDNGNVYVSIEGKMLFKPASGVVDLKGKKGLHTLAILFYNAQEVFTIIIKGASETIALKKLQYANSWSLSQTRGASLMHLLTEPGRKASKEEASLAMKSAKTNKGMIDVKNGPDEPIKNSDQAISKKYVFILVNSL